MRHDDVLETVDLRERFPQCTLSRRIDFRLITDITIKLYRQSLVHSYIDKNERVYTKAILKIVVCMNITWNNHEAGR